MGSKPLPSNDQLDEQTVEMKSGHEKFFSQSLDPNIDVIDFWKWSSSNLLINTTRGVLAEFLVASSLCLVKEPRNNWKSYDIKSKSGIKIEVKSAAECQAWKQDELSPIEFGISKPKDSNRKAEIYVFCVLYDTEPLNLDNWHFYVLLIEHIDQKCGDQAKISLKSLKNIFSSELKECRFHELHIAIEDAEENLLRKKSS